MKHSSFLGFVCMLMSVISTTANAQSTKDISKIKIVYVDSLTSQTVENAMIL